MWHDEPEETEEEPDELEPIFNPATTDDINFALETDEVEVIIDLPLILFNPATMEASEPSDNDEDSN